MPRKFLRLVLLGMTRSRTRLMATVGGSAVGAFIVCFFLAADGSLQRMLDSAGADQNLIVTQKDRFWPTAGQIPDDDARRIRELPSVAEVMPIRLKMTPCMSMTDTVAVHGVDKDLLLSFRHYRVDPGAAAAFRADTAGALIGEKIAARYGWKAGQHITLDQLGGLRLNIHGIFSARGTQDDYIILVGRRYLQEADGAQGMSHHVMVKLRPGADPDAAAREIDALPLTVATATQPERAMLAAALDQLSDLVSASRVVIAVVLLVMLIAMGNAVSMVTRDRARECGIMRVLGFGQGAILGLVLSEAVLQALIGAGLGCAAAQVLVWGDFLETVSACGFSIHLAVGARDWLAALAVIVLAGALGSLLPAWRASRLKVVEALGREE